MTTQADLVPPMADAAPETTLEEVVTKKPRAKRSKFAEMYPDDAALTLLVADNPKKNGSKAHAMFQGYFGSTTVGEARAKGVSYQSIAYDIGRCFIKVG